MGLWRAARAEAASETVEQRDDGYACVWALSSLLSWADFERKKGKAEPALSVGLYSLFGRCLNENLAAHPEITRCRLFQKSVSSSLFSTYGDDRFFFSKDIRSFFRQFTA